jgi:ferredoxin
MEELRNKAKELLEKTDVKVIIGYGEGNDHTIQAVFIRKPADTDKLIYNKHCIQNLAVYLKKNEIRKFGKVCLVANLSALRSVLQIASENQLDEDEIAVITINGEGKIIEFKNFNEIENYVGTCNLDIAQQDSEMISKLESISGAERWEFWSEQLTRCIKCYACRAACPMCYCGRCQVEYNQPQIVTNEATPLGNFEWHVIRAMHLAGRCVSCGECGRACPVGIPIHLLNFKTSLIVKDKFNLVPGTKADLLSALSSYDPDDKENFIR